MLNFVIGFEQEKNRQKQFNLYERQTVVVLQFDRISLKQKFMRQDHEKMDSDRFQICSRLLLFLIFEQKSLFYKIYIWRTTRTVPKPNIHRKKIHQMAP